MTRFTFVAATVAIAGAIAVAPSTHAQSAAPAAPAAPAVEQHDHQPTTGQAPGMMMSDPHMMAMHQKMMAEMKATDGKLDALVAKMNAAKGGAKVDAIAETLTALVQQHKTMRDEMMEMHGQMMMQMHGPMAMPMGGVK